MSGMNRLYSSWRSIESCTGYEASSSGTASSARGGGAAAGSGGGGGGGAGASDIRPPSRGTRVSRRQPNPSVGLDPRHHRAQLTADLLDLRALGLVAHVLEALATGAVLRNPLLGEVA
jgi:hypothetical protein